MHNGRDCAHGRQVGKCDTCDLIDSEQRILELEAQIEQLREVLRYADNKLYILTHNRKDVSPRLLTDADKGYKAVHEAVLGFKDNLNVLVAKRDAEIKAQAVEEILNHFANKFRKDAKLTLKDICWMLNEHLSQIRQQAKE